MNQCILVINCLQQRQPFEVCGDDGGHVIFTSTLHMNFVVRCNGHSKEYAEKRVKSVVGTS